MRIQGGVTLQREGMIQVMNAGERLKIMRMSKIAAISYHYKAVILGEW